jgi:hypothetical protein
MKEILSIYDEFVIGLLNKYEFMSILKYVHQSSFDFVFIDMDNEWDRMYHRDFAKLTLTGV